MVYEHLTRALEAVGSDIDAAECHGMLCGLLATAERFDAEVWLEHAAGRSDLTPFGPPGSGHVVWQVLAETRQALSSGDFALDIILPEDDADIATRAGAIVGWARGFLSAFGLAGEAGYQRLDDDAREFISDLTRIAQLDTRIEDSEANEQMLVELSEFLKVGTLLVYEAALARRAESTPAAGAGRIH